MMIVITLPMLNEIFIAGIIVAVIIFMILRRNSENMINGTRVATFYYAPWCGYCKDMTPEWEKMKVALKGTGIILREEDATITRPPGITAYPTIRVIDENGHTRDHIGAMNFDDLRRWLVTPGGSTQLP